MVPPTLVKVPPVSVIPDACDIMSDLVTWAAEVLVGGGSAEETMKISHHVNGRGGLGYEGDINLS